MNNSGDAAEQVVRLSLEGMEVAARITGSGAKNVAMILAAVLKEEQKTKGKARLSSMIRSGKELKVFTVKQSDLEKFAKEAKRYGVLYSILKEKGNNNPNAQVDVIARAEDASKISRIMDRFNLSSVDKASVIRSAELESRSAFAKAKETGPQSLGKSERANLTMGKPESNRQSVKDTINRMAEEQKRKTQTPSGRNIRKPVPAVKKPAAKGAR